MSVWWVRVMETLVMPPGIQIVMLLLAAVLARRWRRLAWGLAWLAGASLYLVATPVTMGCLAAALQPDPPLSDQLLAASGAQAIVLLPGGRRGNPPEYGGEDVPGGRSLERAMYAAHLQRRTGLPVMVTAGSPLGEAAAEADLLGNLLAEGWGMAPRWRERESRTTWESAVASREILAAAGIDRILLVTHGWHMPRAAWSFRQAGFQVTPAPTLTARCRPNANLLNWLPQTDTLAEAWPVLHEGLGGLWYRVRHGDGSS